MTVHNKPIKKNHLVDFQRLLEKYPSIRFQSNPRPVVSEDSFRLSYSGDVKECNALSNEVDEAGWWWVKLEPKKKWYERFFGL